MVANEQKTNEAAPAASAASEEKQRPLLMRFRASQALQVLSSANNKAKVLVQQMAEDANGFASQLEEKLAALENQRDANTSSYISSPKIS